MGDITPQSSMPGRLIFIPYKPYSFSIDSLRLAYYNPTIITPERAYLNYLLDNTSTSRELDFDYAINNIVRQLSVGSQQDKKS